MPGLGGLGGGLSGAFGGVQIFLYNVAGQIVGAALGPVVSAVSQEVFDKDPNVPLSPEVLAAAVIKGHMTQDYAAQQARRSGVDRARFDMMCEVTGNPPAPESLAIARRRGLMTGEQYLEAIRQSMLRSEYAPLMQQLAQQQPSPEAALHALLEGQIDEATARRYYEQFGGMPEHFDWQFDAQGSAPTPTEAALMADRGIIPWEGTGAGVTSFEQAFLEGPWRNKWAPAFRKMAEHIPPPRTVSAMYHQGALTQAQAAALLTQNGIRPDLIAAYLREGSTAKTAHVKQLAETTALDLYRDKIIDRAACKAFVVDLGWSAEDAEYIMQVEDFRGEAAAIRTAVSRVHTLFVGHKLDAAEAGDYLAQFDVPADRAAELLHVWSIERQANVHTLTAAQIESAWGHAIIDTAAALTEIGHLGYSADDANTLLAIHNKGPLTAEQLAGGVNSAAPAAGV